MLVAAPAMSLVVTGGEVGVGQGSDIPNGHGPGDPGEGGDVGEERLSGDPEAAAGVGMGPEIGDRTEEEEPGNGRRRRRGGGFGRRVGRGLLLFLLVLLSSTLALAIGLLLALVFPPAELMGRAALGALATALEPRSLIAAEVKWWPLERFETRGLVAGAPAPGQRQPLLALARGDLRYETGGLLGRTLRLRKGLLVRPVAHIDLPLPLREVEREPIGWRIRIDSFEVRELGLTLAQDGLQAGIDGVSIVAAGVIAEEESRGQLEIDLAAGPGEANAFVKRGAAPSGHSGPGASSGGAPVGPSARAPAGAAAGELQLDLPLRATGALSVALERLMPLRLRFEGAIEVASRRGRTPAGPLPPLHVAAHLSGEQQQDGGFVELTRGRVEIAGTEVLRLVARAESSELASDRAPWTELDLRLEIKRLHLPLGELAPLARPFLGDGGDLRLAGLIEGEDIVIRSTTSDLRAGRLPAVAGELRLTDISVGADSPLGALSLRRLEGSVRAESPARRLPRRAAAPAAASRGRTERPPPRPPLLGEEESLSSSFDFAAEGLALGPLRFAAPRLSGSVALQMPGSLSQRSAASRDTTGAEQPTRIRAEMRLGSRRARYALANGERIELPVDVRIEAAAALDARRITLESLLLRGGDYLRARARGSLSRLDGGPFQASLTVDLLNLSALHRHLRLPPHPAWPQPALSGRLALAATVAGPERRPLHPVAPLPLRAKLRLDLHQVTVSAPSLLLARSNGTLEAALAAGDLRLSGQLRAQRLELPAAGLALRQLELPFSARLQGGTMAVKIELAAGSADARRAGLSAASLELAGSLSTTVPLPASAGQGSGSPGAIELALDGTAQRAALSRRGATVRARQVSLGMRAARETRAGPVTLAGQVRVGQARQETPRRELRGLSLRASGSFGGLGPGQLPLALARLAELRGRLSARARVDSFRQPGVLDPPLRGAELELELSADLARRLFLLHGLTLTARSHGLRARASGRAGPLLVVDHGAIPAEPLELRAVVELDASLGQWGHVTLPGAGGGAEEPAEALAASGKLQLELQARGSEGAHVTVGGRLLARDFSLAHRSVTLLGDPDEVAERRMTTVRLRRLAMSLPFRQDLLVDLQQGRLRAIGQSSIFDDPRVWGIYDSIRLFTTPTSNLTLDGIDIEEQRVAVAPEEAAEPYRRRLRIGPAMADVEIENGVIHIRQVNAALFEGDLVGAGRLQLSGLRPFDLRAQILAQLSGVDLAYLVPRAREQGRDAPFGATARFDYQYSGQKLEGELNIEKVSREGLVLLLTYADPQELDDNLTRIRDILGSWYSRLVNPEVTAVEVWVQQGKASMDIEVDAVWPFGPMLRSALDGVRVRGFDLQRFLPGRRELDEDFESQVERRFAARRRVGPGGLYQSPARNARAEDAAGEPDPGELPEARARARAGLGRQGEW